MTLLMDSSSETRFDLVVFQRRPVHAAFTCWLQRCLQELESFGNRGIDEFLRFFVAQCFDNSICEIRDLGFGSQPFISGIAHKFAPFWNLTAIEMKR
jgi:hypothetical protein